MRDLIRIRMRRMVANNGKNNSQNIFKNILLVKDNYAKVTMKSF